jgi:signal transduction histidine kinase
MEQWVATVSHEIKNPLTAIVMATGVLQRKTDPDHPTIGLINTLGRSAKAIELIINDLLDTASMRDGKFTITREWVDAASLKESLHLALTSLAAYTKNTLSIKLTGRVLCDPIRISQCVINLASNALKFTDCGEVSIRGEELAEGYTIQIRDTGMGISEKDLNRIFDKFWQAEGKNKRMGTGLGLSIVQGIVESHKGKIQVESKVGIGTSFTIFIPEDEIEIQPQTWADLLIIESRGMRKLAVKMRLGCAETKRANARILERTSRLIEEMRKTKIIDPWLSIGQIE